MTSDFSALPVSPTASVPTHLYQKPKPHIGRYLRLIRGIIGTLLALVLLPLLGHAATLTWTNELGGNWSVAENWSPNQVPGNGDRAVINQVGTYTVTVTAPLTLGVLELGSAAGPGTQTLDLNGFAVRLQSASVVQPTGKLRIDVGASVLDLSTAVNLVNQGSVIWANGAIALENGAVIQNEGLWDTTTDSTLVFAGGVAPAFRNSGKFRKSGGTGTSTIGSGLRFENLGTVEIRSGSLNIGGDGQASSPGTFDIATGSSLVFGNSYTLNSGTVLKGDGDVAATAGIFTLDGEITFTRLTLAEASLAGNHVLKGSFFWSGGAGRGGTTTIAEGSTLQFTNPAYDYDLSSFGRSLINQGVVLFGGRRLFLGNGSNIQNSGLWENTADNALVFGGGVASTFQNSGTFRKSGSTGVSTVGSGLRFNNVGSVEIQSGTLTISGDGQASSPDSFGSFDIAAGSSLIFDHSYTLASGTVLKGDGDVAATAGFLTMEGEITFARLTLAEASLAGNHVLKGNFFWSGGAGRAGTTTIAEGSSLQFTNRVYDYDLGSYGRSLVNQGIIRFAGRSLYLGNGSSIQNNGLWETTTDSLLDFGGGAASSFQNIGTFRKAASTGTSTIGSGLTFNHAGTLEVLTGTVRIAGPRSLQGTVLVGLSSLSGFGRLSLPGNGAFSGKFIATTLGGYLPRAGDTFDVVTYDAASGAFSQVDLPLSAAWETSYNANAFQLRVLNSRPLPPALGDSTLNELTLLTVTNSATDLDLPANQLSYALLQAPAGMSVQPDGLVSWIPGEADGPGTNLVTVVVTDNGVPPLSATNSFQVVVREVNVPPSLSLPGSLELPELSALIRAATVSDPDLPTNALTVTLVSGPPGLTVSPAGEIQWTPSESDGPGLHPLTLRVTDQNPMAVNETELSTNLTVTFQVRELNQPPSLTVPTNQVVLEELPLLLSAQALDTDLPPNPLTFRLLTPPPGLSINATNGQLSWTPTESQGSNTYQIAIAVADESPLALNEVQFNVTNSFSLTVLESNRPPVLVLPSLTRLNELVSGALAATGTDPDEPANTLSFSLVSGPPGLTVAEDGTIAWTPTEAQGPSTNDVIIRLSDTNSAAENATTLSVTNQFQIVVDEVNTPPVLALVEDRSARPGQVIRFTVSATDADLPVNPLTFSLGTGNPGGSLNASSGEFFWRPGTAAADTTNQFQLQVSDGSPTDSIDSQSFLIVVGPLAPLTLTLVSHDAGTSLLKVTGPVDLDYFLEASTDLGSWTNLTTRLSAPANFELLDSTATDPSRFYRVRLEP
ncbi:MAG: cadherin repeat domain-containing protein [Verrucomicrobia bacterium]|nr:cadherin repeat domain-containing protein [Verrucomicrobiota bacterium]